ncbi:MAG: CapA family protein [Tessaracoccus sp.]|uniref:CapA family protein n=1 Tax=Tessaracoccus sp. TaxID=1971211 RepID=UPI001EC627AA|nr:CapA family protein [Tessaracoccus sp.]MBK7821474.1 CapA family protein [Tessaracoccus sp.]
MRRLPLALVILLLAGCAPQPAPETSSPTPIEPAPSSSSPTPSDTPTPSPTPTTFVPRTASVNVSGDLLWHNSLWVSAELDAKKGRFDFRPQLRSLREYVSAADLAICHSEVPFAKKDGPFRNYPLFAAPQEIAPAIVATGWDLCTTASNHTMDQGWDGLVRTIEVHREHGILTSGSWATEEDRKTPVIFTTDDGVKIAVISQTFGLNGLPKAKGKPWSVQLLDADAAIADAKRAKKAGADIVLVHMHAGDEYSSRINSQQRDFAKAVTAAPEVDMVFGQHAHVVQPIDKVNDKWVIYGAGNLIASSGPAQPRTYDGLMAQVTFEEQENGGFVATAAEFAPTMITKKSGNTPARVYLIPDELKAGNKRAADMKASAARTRKTVRSLDVEGLTERK